jgi:TorA maturation chaperone TorD
LNIAPSLPAVNFAEPDDGEELARAEVYGLLAQLFYAPPTEALYGQFQVAVTVAPVTGAFLEGSWSELVATARRLDRDAIRREFDALFQGIGKPEIFLYASFYLSGKLNEKPLVDLRHSLRALGLERAEGLGETEDHVASLCEVMRFLIAGEDVGTSNLAAQRRFFDAHLRPWVETLCDAIEANPVADFYRAVARFSRDFFAVEAEGFDLLDA